MHRYFTAIISSFFYAVALADTAGEMITDRPNTERLKLPNFIPEHLPSFTLPPVEEHILHEETVNRSNIILKAVEFSGNSVISSAQLQTLAQPFIGKAIAVTELEELRLKISLYYNEQGYINSGAVLPEQNFQNGIIQLQIIEGKLSDIQVSGTGWLSPNYIKDRLHYHSDEPLNIYRLRENFQQLLLDPLIERMNADLIPSSKRGESIFAVAVTRARPYQVNLSIDNYRPPSIGSEQGKLSGWLRNSTGLGDIIDATLLYSAGSLGGNGGFSMPLNAYNTLFNFRFNLNDAAIVEPTLKAMHINSEYIAYDFELVQPLIQNVNRNSNLGVSFNIKENKTSLLGEDFSFIPSPTNNGLSKDSVLRFSLDFTERLEHHVFSARATTSMGINAFNATWHEDKVSPDSDFVTWLGQVQYAGLLLNSRGTLILRGDMQYSPDKLMTMERFSLGGRYSIRGYRENEIVKDNGYSISAEYRYPLLNDQAYRDIIGQITLFPFMDYGAAWNRGHDNQVSYLHSLGIGVEWQASNYVSTEIIYAYAINPAINKADYDLQDSGVHWRVNIAAF